MADPQQSNPRIGPTAALGIAVAIFAVPVAMIWHILRAPIKVRK